MAKLYIISNKPKLSLNEDKAVYYGEVSDNLVRANSEEEAWELFRKLHTQYNADGKLNHYCMQTLENHKYIFEISLDGPLGVLISASGDS